MEVLYSLQLHVYMPIGSLGEDVHLKMCDKVLVKSKGCFFLQMNALIAEV